MEARYQGVQLQLAVAYVDMQVRRNEHTPQFTQGEFRKELLENFPLGAPILTVQATDQDAHVSASPFLLYYHVIQKPLLSSW